jgi:putative transposase
MPRPPRLQFEGAFYHAFSRGNRREAIFLDDQDYFNFERFLADAVARSTLCVYAWCLMPNHFHLLLETPDGDLAEFMKCLLTRYAQYFNWRHGLSGHVFERRYQSIVCEKEPYFLELIRYIHLNPYRAKTPGLIGPSGWKWSSLRFYDGLEAPSSLQKGLREGLERFGADPAAARQAHRQFLADGLSSGQWEAFYRVKAKTFLGSDAFVEQVKRRTAQPVRDETRSLRRIRELTELAAVVEQTLAVSEERLRSTSQEDKLSLARSAFIYIAVRRYRFPGVKVAQYLNRGKAAISIALRRFETTPSKSDFSQRLLTALQL